MLRDGALVADRARFAVADARRAPRGQRLHLGADPRGRHPVRRHLRRHHSGAGDAAGRDATARSRCCCTPSPRTTARPHEAAYFWLTGVLSAFLDNAPTYLVFFELAGGDAQALMGPLGRHARGDLDGRGLHGRADLYRQRAEPDGPLDRAGTRHRDAELLRLHVVGGLVLIPLFALLTLLPISPLLNLR